MYAGAVRETVFSRADVVARVNESFVALSTRAPLVNGLHAAGDPDEERLYRRLKRVMLAPQGIGVLDAEGRVLTWVQMFDGEDAVMAFLDRGLERFREASASPAAERHMRYPSEASGEVPFEEDGQALAVGHAEGVRCPADSERHGAGPEGALAVELTGRVLDEEGGYSGDTVRQESYTQDQFAIDLETQRAVAAALGDARGERVRLPEALGRLLAMNAYLGHIDVRPLENPRSGRGELTRCELWGTATAEGARVEGSTSVKGVLDGPDGHEHEVTLEWRGYLVSDGDRIVDLVLLGEGKERSKFGLHRSASGEGEEAFLPAGRAVDLEARVRYGLLGRPIGAREAVAPLQDRAQEIQRKMKQVHEGVQRWQQEGRDPSPIGRILERFEPLMKQGRIDEAEAILDEALEALDGE